MGSFTRHGKSVRIRNDLSAFLERQTARAEFVMAQVLVIGASNAALYTPIGKTTNLLNSQYRRIIVQGSKVTGLVGYTVEYASIVHNPKVIQNFRRATAKKEFLTLGFEDMRGAIEAKIREGMKV